MDLRSDARFLLALTATNLKAALAQRGAFWLAAFGMVANNLLYFSIWWIFFSRFDEVRGWRLPDMMVLFGVVATAFGTTVVFLGGVRELGREIVEGGLDPFMTQPKSLLVSVLASKCSAAGCGDIATGLLLIGLSGLVDARNAVLIPVAVATSATVFAATGTLLQSLAFWLGRVETLARMVWEFLITFSTYPQPIFSGALRIVLFSVIPAGFIGFLPAGLLRDFSVAGLAAALGGAVVYAALAVAVFRAGLRRYESGNRFGVRG